MADNILEIVIKAKDEFTGTMKGLTGGLPGLGAAAAAAGAAVAAAGTAIFTMTKHVAEAHAKIFDFSQQLGLSTGFISKMQYSAQLAGVEFQQLEIARKRTGAGKTMIEISDREWEAIQAGAVSNARLKDILKHTDIDKVKKLATPKPKRLMSDSKTSRAQAMLASGKYTRQQVAAALGVSLSTLDRATNGEE